MKGERALEKLTAAGARAETSVNKLTREVAAGRQIVQGYENSVAGTRRQIAEAARAWSQAGTATREATAGIAAARERIESTTQTLVRQRRELKENEATFLNYKRAGQSTVTGMRLLQRTITEQRAEIRATNSAIRQAEREIEKYGSQGAKAAKQVGETRDRIATLRATLERQNAALKNADTAFRANVQAHGRARRATRQTTEAVKELTGAARAQATSIRAAGVSAHQATNQAAALAHQSGASARHVANLSAQFNDIGVMLASGQNPLILALQQGTQINQVFQTMGQRVGILQSLGTAFKAIISPQSLATIAIIAGGAALAQWGIKAVTAGRETRTLKDLMEDLTEAVNEYESASRASLQSQEDLIETYGRHADRVREILQAQRALAEEDALTQARALPFTSDDLHILVEAAQAGDTAKHVFLDVANSIREAMAELAGAEGPEEILAGLRKVEDLRQKLIGMVDLEREGMGGLAEENREITASMLQREETIARISGLRAKETEDARAEREERERLAEVAERMLGTGRESIQLKAAELVYGKESLEYALERLDIELRSKGITGAQAAERRRQVTSEHELTQRIKERAEAAEALIQREKEAARAKERAFEVGGRIIQQQRQENELLKARAEFGQDSSQYKEAERRIEREKLEIQLQQAGVEEGNANRARAQLEDKHRLLDIDQARIELEKKLTEENQALVGAAQALTKEKERQIDAENKAREVGQLAVEQAQSQNALLEARATYGRESLQYLEAEREIERENLALKLKRSGIDDDLAQKALRELSRSHELQDIERDRIERQEKLTREHDALTAAAKEFTRVEEESIEISARRLEQYISISRSLSEQIELNQVEAVYGRQSLEYLQQQQVHRARALEADIQRLGLSKEQTEELRRGFTALAEQEQKAHSIAEQQERLLASSKAMMEQERDLAKFREEEVRRLERLAEAETNAVRSMRERVTLIEAEAAHGQGSIELLRARHEIERQNLEIEIEKSGYRDEAAQALRTDLANVQRIEQAERQRAIAEKERVEAQKQSERIAKAIARAYQAQLRIVERRQEVENRLTRGLEDRLRIARFSLQYGRDSIEVQNVLRNIERERLDTLLDQERITGDARDRIIEMHEAAEQLDTAIEQNEEVMRGVLGVVDDIATAWGEFVVRGFDDFKSFTKSVMDTFKRLLVQMVAEAAKAKILNFLGFGGGGGIGGAGGGVAGNIAGSLVSGAASGIGSAFAGSALGGAGAAAAGSSGFSPLLRLGGQIIGRLTGITDKLTAAIGIGASSTAAAGSLAANTFAAYGPGQAAASVAAAGAAPVAGAGAGAFAGLAAAAPWIIGAIALFSFLTAKWKTIDTGVRITTDNFETLVETFERQKKRRFLFGSKKRTLTEELDEETAGPIRDAVSSVWREVKEVSEVIGIGADAFSDFRKVIDISTKGLSATEQEEKFTEALLSLREELAETALASAGLSFESEKAAERLVEFVNTFKSVNAVLEQLGAAGLDASVEGAKRAEELIGRFGGQDQFASATDSFFQTFYSEAERIEALRSNLDQAFAGFDTAMPDSLAAYRELVQAQDLMTDKGQELYTVLVSLSGNFANLINYENQLAEARRQSAEQAVAAIAILERLGNTQLGSTDEGVDRAQELIARFGGGDQFASVTDAFYQSFYSEAERMEALRSDLEAVFNQFDVTLPDSLETYKELAQAQDLMTDKGQELYSVLLSLSGDFSNLIGYEESLAEARRQVAIATEEAASAAESAITLLKRLGNTWLEASEQGIQSASDLVARFGGEQPFTAAINAFYQSFYSEAERMETLRSELEAAFSNVDLSLPETIDGYRDLVNAQDLMTDKGQELYAVLLSLSGNFADLAQYEADLAEARLKAAEAAERAAQAEASAAAKIAREAADLSGYDINAGVVTDFTSAIRELSSSLNDVTRDAESAARSVDEIRYAPTNIRAPSTLEGAISQLDLFRRAARIQEDAAKRAAAASSRSASASRSHARSANRYASTAAQLSNVYNRSLTDTQRHLQNVAVAARGAAQEAALIQRYAGGSGEDTAAATQAATNAVNNFNNSITETQQRVKDAAEAQDRASQAAADASRRAAAAARRYANTARALKELSEFLFEVRHLGLQFDVTHDKAVRFGKELIKLGGGFDEFGPKLAGYYQSFFSEQERLRNLWEDLTLDFEHLSVGMPSTIDGFRRLVESQDLMTKEGRELFVALVGISDAFAAAARASEEARKAEQERREALRGALQQNSVSLTRAFDGELAAIEERIGQLSRRFSEMGRTIPSVDAAFRKFSREIFELYTVDSPFLRDLPTPGVQEINQYLKELTTLSTPEALRELIDGLDTSTDAGLRFHQILSEMALEFKDLTEQSEALTAQLAEQRRANYLTYLREFVGPAAEVGELMKELVGEFDRLNLALPGSHAEFRELVESIDPATESGANLIRELYALAGQFDDVQDRINSLSTDRVEDAVDQIARARERAIRENTRQDAEAQIRSDQEGFQRLLEGFFPERTVLDRTFSDLADQLNTLGVTVPQTRDMFVDLVTGINLATESGRGLYSQLLGLAGPLDDFFSRSENLLRASEEAAVQQFRDQLATEVTQGYLDDVRGILRPDNELYATRAEQQLVETQESAIERIQTEIRDAVRNGNLNIARLLRELIDQDQYNIRPEELQYQISANEVMTPQPETVPEPQSLSLDEDENAVALLGQGLNNNFRCRFELSTSADYSSPTVITDSIVAISQQTNVWSADFSSTISPTAMGRTYYVRARLESSDGNLVSGWVEAQRTFRTETPVVTLEAPGRPPRPTVSRRTDGLLSVEVGNAATGGRPSAWRWRLSLNNTFTDSDMTFVTDNPSLVLDNLEASTNYWIDVRAENATGNSAYSPALATSTMATVIPAPGAPDRPTISQTTQTSITASTRAAQSGATTTAFDWRLVDAEDNVVATQSTSQPSVKFDNLDPDTPYFLDVRARGVGGASSYSPVRAVDTEAVPVVFKTPGVPGQPTVTFNIASQSSTTTRITLTTEPASTGGDPGLAPTDFEWILYREGKYLRTTVTDAPSVTWDDLDQETNYSAQVRARNTAGNSAYSDSREWETAFTIITRAMAPPTPTVAVAAADIDETQFIARATAGSGGGPTEFWEFTVLQGSTIVAGPTEQAGSAYTARGLTADTGYTVRIRAGNGTRTGRKYSAAVTASVTTDEPAVAIPPAPLYSRSGDRITLTIPASAPSGRYDLQTYNNFGWGLLDGGNSHTQGTPTIVNAGAYNVRRDRNLETLLTNAAMRLVTAEAYGVVFRPGGGSGSYTVRGTRVSFPAPPDSDLQGGPR